MTSEAGYYAIEPVGDTEDGGTQEILNNLSYSEQNTIPACQAASTDFSATPADSSLPKKRGRRRGRRTETAETADDERLNLTQRKNDLQQQRTDLVNQRMVQSSPVGPVSEQQLEVWREQVPDRRKFARMKAGLERINQLREEIDDLESHISILTAQVSDASEIVISVENQTATGIMISAVDGFQHSVISEPVNQEGSGDEMKFWNDMTQWGL